LRISIEILSFQNPSKILQISTKNLFKSLTIPKNRQNPSEIFQNFTPNSTSPSQSPKILQILPKPLEILQKSLENPPGILFFPAHPKFRKNRQRSCSGKSCKFLLIKKANAKATIDPSCCGCCFDRLVIF